MDCHAVMSSQLKANTLHSLINDSSIVIDSVDSDTPQQSFTFEMEFQFFMKIFLSVLTVIRTRRISKDSLLYLLVY